MSARTEIMMFCLLLKYVRIRICLESFASRDDLDPRFMKNSSKMEFYPGNEKKLPFSNNSVTKKFWITFLVSWKFLIFFLNCPNILDCIELTIPSFSDPYRPNRYPRGDPAMLYLFKTGGNQRYIVFLLFPIHPRKRVSE